MIDLRKIFVFVLTALFYLSSFAFSQEVNLEVTIDMALNTTPTPAIFKPNIDLSGRGFNQDNTWPQGLAAKEVLDLWSKEIGFPGLYRIQYNLWDINQLAKNKESQDKLSANYEEIIKKISGSGGTVILNIFGTPPGLGKALDKRSAILNSGVYKALIKEKIRYLSCEMKYKIWYEVWTAPDLDDFFIGRKQDYLNTYKLIAESVKELEAEFKVDIPIGAPSTSQWFHNLENNSVLTPEKSLIYDLIKFCSSNKLPLDFITWHAFSHDPKTEKEITIYNKNSVELIRDWLSYFNFKRDIPLIIDEWNYDRDANILPARQRKSYIAASFIPARIKNMFEAGLDNQIYFSLEDFQDNQENVNRNVGAFYFDSTKNQYKGGYKAVYNVFKMLKKLGPQMLTVKFNDDFAGIIATKSQDELSLLIYNYIDPETGKSYLIQNIAILNDSERQQLIRAIRTDQLAKFIAHEQETLLLRATPKVKPLLTRARELSDRAKQFKDSSRNIKISIKGAKGDYSYTRFVIEPPCGLDCEYKPVEEKDVSLSDQYQEDLKLSPYSVNLIVLKSKPVVVEEAQKTENNVP